MYALDRHISSNVQMLILPEMPTGIRFILFSISLHFSLVTQHLEDRCPSAHNKLAYLTNLRKSKREKFLIPESYELN